MRVLFVTPYVPSPIRVRPYQIIRHLARLGHRVTLVAIDGDRGAPGTDAALSEMRDACEAVHVVPLPKGRAVRNCLAALPTGTPLWAAYCRSPEALSLVRSLVDSGGFDVAHVEHLRAVFVRPALGKLPAVLDVVDCIADLQRQMAAAPGPLAARAVAWEEAAKLRRYEPRAYTAFDRIAVTTRHEADVLDAVADAAGISLPSTTAIPNGVDLEYFRPHPDNLPGSSADTLAFWGKLSYRANADAARWLLNDILPRVREKRPGAGLILAGSGPPDDLRALAARVGNVEVTGYVDDLRPILSRARVAVFPLRIAAGVQNKALEAMALGLPVVATGRVAGPLSGAPIRTGETAEQIADACVGLLDASEEQRRESCRASRAYVEQAHHWEDAARAFESLYRAALADHSERGG